MCWTCAAFLDDAVTMHRHHTKSCKTFFKLKGNECEKCQGPHHTDACAEITQGSGGRHSPKEEKEEDERDASKDGAADLATTPGGGAGGTSDDDFRRLIANAAVRSATCGRGFWKDEACLAFPESDFDDDQTAEVEAAAAEGTAAASEEKILVR